MWGEAAGWVTAPVQDPGPVTQRLVLDTVEARYPMLLGTIRDRRGGGDHQQLAALRR